MSPPSQTSLPLELIIILRPNILMLQITKLRHREVKWFAQRHTKQVAGLGFELKQVPVTTTLGWWFSKCDLRISSISVTWKHTGNHILRSYLGLIKSKTRGWGPKICVLASPLGNFDEQCLSLVGLL